MRYKSLKNLFVFFVALGSMVASVNSFSQSYAEKLSNLEKPLGSEAQAGLYSQNYRISFQIVLEGIKKLENNDLDGAETDFNKAVSMSEFAYTGYAYLGIIEMKRNNYDKAIEFHKKAMESFKKYKKNILARKREYIKDLETRVVVMEKELDKHGLNYEGGTDSMSLATSFKFQTIREKNPGYHQSKLNDYKNLIKSLKHELLDDLKRSYPPYFFVQYGICYQTKGDLNKAMEAYKNALRIDPNYGLAYSNLASCFYLAGEKDLAKKYYKAAKKLNAPVHPALAKEFN